MFKKSFIIVIIVIIFAGIWYFGFREKVPQINEQEQACVNAGGAVKTASCCESASDFPNLCLIGACGCSLQNSREIKICECNNGCWNGTKCVSNLPDTSDWQTYTNPKYNYTMKYPADWTVKHEFGPNEILGQGYYESNRFDSPSGYALLFAIVPKDGDVMPIPRTGVGSGDFVDSGDNDTVTISGTEVGIKQLVFQDKVKEIFFNDFEISGMKGRAYLSYFGSENYSEFDMTDAEEIAIAKAILSSVELK